MLIFGFYKHLAPLEPEHYLVATTTLPGYGYAVGCAAAAVPRRRVAFTSLGYALNTAK